MLNHRIPKQTSWTYSDEREGFIIEAMEDIERGEQVYDSYGRKCNSRFFLNYGFINMDNDANEVAVAVHFDKDDPSLKQKEEMMMEKAQPKIIRILDNYEENNVLEFFGYLRFISLKDSQKLLVLQNIYESQMSQTNDNQTNSKQFKPSKTPPISVENESEMWARVKAICQTSLAKYKTTLEVAPARLPHASFHFSAPLPPRLFNKAQLAVIQPLSWRANASPWRCSGGCHSL